MDKKEKQKIYDKKHRQTAKGKASHKKSNKNWYEKNKEKIKEKSNQYHKDNRAKNLVRLKEYAINNPDKIRISQWRCHGIITNNWNNVYDVYMNTTNCDYCNKEFKNSLDRHLDHDHNINDSNNIRGILCRVCNTSDVLKGYPPIF